MPDALLAEGQIKIGKHKRIVPYSRFVLSISAILLIVSLLLISNTSGGARASLMTPAAKYHKALDSISGLSVAYLAGIPGAGGPVPKDLPRADWLSMAKRDLAIHEYRISNDQKGRYQAPNRAQNLRTRFSPDGITLSKRDPSKGDFTITLKFSGIGRRAGADDRLKTVPRAKISSTDRRAELVRGTVTEWYKNEAQGLEQGFTINTRPGGSGKVILAQELDGATAILDDKQNATLKDKKSNKTLLKYSNLSVADASGRKLSSELQVKDGQLRIVYSDEGASYPVTVDPLITTPVTTVEGDQDTSYFGYSVAGAGDVNNDGYDDVIVGAYMYDNGSADEGAAFVYHGSSSGVSTTATATLEANLAGSQFGRSVSGVGDVNGDGYGDVIVGAMYFANPTSNEGAAFVYHGSGSGVSTTPAVTLDSNQSGAYMGSSVSGGGDFNNDGYSDVIVGASYFDNGSADEGAAFVFHGSSSGVSAVRQVTLDSNQASAYSGVGVAGTGDVNGDGYGDVVVGASSYDNGESNEGGAFVYHGSSSGISSSSSATLESNQASATFGQQVSSAGDVNNDGYDDVIVGAYLYDNPTSNEGAAFVYHGSGSGVSTTPAATVDGNQATGWFGWSVSGAGDLNADGYDDVIVGAQRFDRPTPDEGVAYTYQGSASGISTTTTDVLESNQGGSYFGIGVSGAGDVNGDGYADVIVGARAYDNGNTDEGAAFVYHSLAAADTTPPTTSLTTSPTTADGQASWFITAPTITLGRSESGSTGYRWDGAAANTAYSGAFAYNGGQGTHTLYYQSTDDALNLETPAKSTVFKVDTVAPTNPVLTSSTHATSQYSSNNQVTVNFGASSDASSGVASFSYAFDTSAVSTPDATADAGVTSATSGALADGTSHYFHLRSRDVAGNWSSASHFGPFYIDTTAPSASSNTPLNGATGVSVDTNVTVTFSEDVSQDTLTASTVTLKSSTNDTVAAALSYDSPTKTVTINPNTNLLYSQTYTANVTTGVKDAAGNALSPAHSFSFTTAAPADTTPPTTTLTKNPASADGDDLWYLSAPGLSLSANEGTQDTQYQWDSSAGAWTSGNAPTASQGSHTLYYRSIDTAGNTEDAKSAAIKLDSVNPANPTSTTSSHPTGTTSSDVTIEMSFSGASDASSGIDGYSRSFTTGATDAADTTKDLEEGATGATSGSLAGGVWYFHLRTRDNAGNWATTQHYGPMTVDVTAPTTTLSTSPVSADGDDSWFITSPTITLARSGSGSTGYRWDGASANTAYSGAFAYNGGQGSHTLYYQSTDDVSNVETPLSQVFKVDTVAPTNPVLTSSTHATSQYSSNNQVTVNFGASSDASSGVASFSYAFDTSAVSTPDTTAEAGVTSATSGALGNGTSHYFHLRTKDIAGNWSAASHFGPFYIDTTAPSASSSTPLNGATGVSVGANTTVTFSEDVSADTITASTFTLKSSTNDTVSAVLSYDAPSRTATLNPNGNLLYSQTYTGSVTTGVRDAAGNALSPAFSFSFTTGAAPDTTPPTTTLTKNPASADGDDLWYLSAPGLSLSANEGTQDTQYQWDSSAGAWTSGNAPTPGQGDHTLYYRSIDTAGNTEDAKSAAIKLDSVSPANPTATTSSHPTGTTSSDVTIEMSFSGASDASSGIDGYSRSFTTGATDAADTTKDLEEGATGATSGSLAGGVWYFHLRTRDNAGNWAATQHYGPMTIDVTAPTTTLSTDPLSADGDDSWFITSPTITLTRSGSGSTGYRWDGASANTTYSGAFAYNGGQGTHTLYYRSTDDVQNVETPELSQVFKVDTVAPTNPVLTSSTHATSQYSSNNQVTVNFGASSDASSGVSGFSYEFDTSAATVPNTVVDPAISSVTSGALADGTSHYFHLRSRDVAGNWSSASHFGPFYIDTTAPTVTATSPANGATDVATTTNVTVTFSDNMSEDTIIGANFELESSTGDPVSVALTWDGGTKTATLNPATNLLTEEEYTATVSTGVKDEAGNSMAAPHEVSFTTGIATDTVSPSVPRTAWSHVFSTTEGRLYWTEATDDTAVTLYEIYDNGGALVGTSTGTSFDLPVLTPGDTYRYRIKACDDAGNKSAYSKTVVVKAAYTDTTLAGAGNDSTTVAPAEGYSITYFDVTDDGLTTVTEIANSAAAPSNVTFLDRAVNITTTSGFDGEIIIGVSYTEGAVSNESRLRLYHYEGGQWVDVTTYVDTENNIVFGATTSLSPFVVGNPGSGGGWWKESTADPLGSAEWQGQVGNSTYGSPHGGFSTTSNLCKTCHAVHNSKLTSFRLLKNDSRAEECNYCHMGVSGLSRYRLYAFEDLGISIKGEHSLGSTEVPDSTLVGQGAGRVVSADAETGQLASRGGPYDDNDNQQLYCYSCHSVHGANTITDPLAGGWTRRILRVNPGGAPGAFDANDGLNAVNATALGFSATVRNDNTSSDSRALTPVKSQSTIRGVFCGSCHNRNFNFRENEDDGHDYSLQRASHPMGTDGTLDAGGGAGFAGNTKVSWQNVAWCGSCHAAPVEIGGSTPDAGTGYAGASGTDKNSEVADGLDWGTTWYASGFPHQSSSNKLLFESYSGGARDATATNDALESLSDMDSVCVRCHSEDGTFNSGVSGVGSSF